MSLMSPFLKQTATLESLLGDGPWGKTYADPVTISCRFEEAAKLVRLSETETWTSEAHIFADVELKKGDKITFGGVTKEIQKISHVPGLGGQNTFWEGWL